MQFAYKRDISHVCVSNVIVLKIRFDLLDLKCILGPHAFTVRVNKTNINMPWIIFCESIKRKLWTQVKLSFQLKWDMFT